MVLNGLNDIPRIFTAIAEISACLIYIIPSRKKYKDFRQILYMLLGPILLISIQLINGRLPIMFWLPGMVTAVFVMYFFIRSTCDITGYEAGYIMIRAFILAEFVAALEWQFYYYVIYKGFSHSWMLSVASMLVIYIPCFLLVFWFDGKKVALERQIGVSLKELINAALIALATFSINNINFVMDSPFVESQAEANLLYVRTLVDFCGLLLLFAWTEQRRQMQLDREVKVLNDMLYKHYDQYQASKDSVEIINRRYHDLKHQINLIRSEQDPIKKEEYLEEIDKAMLIYESQYDTGNKVVDTILTNKSYLCKQNDINMSCVVNSALLDFMLVMDICSIFGNALDNSIESVMQLKDAAKRIIRVAVFSKNNFLMIRFENYYEHDIKFHEGDLETTKSDSIHHGYGIKSIKQVIEKYDGTLTISTENNWFTIRILVPLREEDAL
ncbi:MAG: sensor histidine kinase [Clostridiales bacterium]|nr:sensor histidine kinase [Clostridiales bacterium]